MTTDSKEDAYEGSTDYQNKALIVVFLGPKKLMEQNLFGFQNEGRLWSLLDGINFMCHTTLELRDERSPCTMKPFSSTSLLAVPSKD